MTIPSLVSKGVAADGAVLLEAREVGLKPEGSAAVLRHRRFAFGLGVEAVPVHAGDFGPNAGIWQAAASTVHVGGGRRAAGAG